MSEILMTSTTIDALSANQTTIFSLLQSLHRDEYFEIIGNVSLLKNYIAFRSNFKSFDNSTVVKLLFKCSVINNENYKRSNFNTIQRIFETLCNVPEIYLILKTVEEPNHNVSIVFDCASKVGLIPRNSSGELTCPLSANEDTFGFLIHELTVLAMQEIYENDGKPYRKNEASREKFFNDLLFELSKDENIQNHFSKNLSHVEILPIFFKFLLFCEKDTAKLGKVIKSLKPLFNFYYQVTIDDMETKIPRIPFVTGNFR